MTRLAWIKRRARRLASGFGITRRDAVANAFLDYASFHPNTPGALRHTKHI